MPYMGKSPTAAVAETSAKTAAYTVIASDSGKTILCSAASADYAVALTAAATLGNGFTVTLKKTDATKFMITINPNSTETIDGLLDLKLRNEHSEATLICDGSNWHIQSHKNVAIEGNCIQNPSFQVDQYSHITRTGQGDDDEYLIDRWRIRQNSASARWTMSQEGSGGVDAKSKWLKMLCTTADASPGSAEEQWLQQSMTGNNGLQFLGTDGLFENGVLSFDVIGHLDTPDAPYSLSVNLYTLDGTSRNYRTLVSITTDAVWQRVSIVVPEDGTADIDPGVTESFFLAVSLYAGTSRDAAAGWSASSGVTANSSQNWASATDNYIGITNVKLQPGQIATPFIPRLYEEELEICKYYFEKRINANAYSPLANSFNRSTTIAAGFYGFTEKRVGSTIAFSGATEFGVTHGSSADTQTSGVTAEEATARGCRLKFTVGSGLTAGEGSLLANWNNTTAYVTVSSEF